MTSLLFLTAGCSQNNWGTLEGTVQLNGAPVGPGTIMLEPIEGNGPGAMATFGEDGEYTVMSAGRKEGAPAGEYRVTIHGGDALSEGAGPQAKTDIPPRYAQADLSNLTVKIEPGDNTKDFQLEP
jgi:hypothetical protein